MKIRATWFALGMVAAALLAWGLHSVVGRSVPPPLPPEIVEVMVPVETVREIEVSGPERVVERVMWRTEPGDVDPATVRELAAELAGDCPPEAPRSPVTPPTMQARVDVEADQYEGAGADGRLVRGWVGTAACSVRFGEGLIWRELAREPFDLSASTAETVRPVWPDCGPRRGSLETAMGVTSAPGLRAELRLFHPGRRWGYWASADYAFSPDSYLNGDAIRSEATWTAAVGVARRWGR